ncbi:MAG TPA: hypothetical protein P5131_07385, partial [Methanoculleus sp.]|nr:hypothetical protein [Methanoculleus sp.]
MAAKTGHLTESKLDDIVLYSLNKSLAIAIIAGSVWISVTFIIDPAIILGEYARLVSEEYFAAAAVASFVNLYGRWMASQTDLDDRIIRVLEVSARYVIWFIAILMVTIPNSKVSSSVIVNYALPDVKLEIRIPISAAYGSD